MKRLFSLFLIISILLGVASCNKQVHDAGHNGTEGDSIQATSDSATEHTAFLLDILKEDIEQ